MVWSMALDCNLDFNPGNQNLVFKSSVLSDRQTFSFWITFLWNLIKFASVVFDLEKIVRVMPMTVNCDLNLCDGNFVGNTPFHFGTHFSGVWLKSLQLFLSYHRHTICMEQNDGLWLWHWPSSWEPKFCAWHTLSFWFTFLWSLD